MNRQKTSLGMSLTASQADLRDRIRELYDQKREMGLKPDFVHIRQLQGEEMLYLGDDYDSQALKEDLNHLVRCGEIEWSRDIAGLPMFRPAGAGSDSGDDSGAGSDSGNGSETKKG